MFFNNERDTKLLSGAAKNSLSKQNHKLLLADNTSANVSFLKRRNRTK
jgi:hypothetical protein